MCVSTLRCCPVLVAAALVLSPVGTTVAAQADRAAIQRAADHLIGSQLPGGLLAYDFDFLTGSSSSNDSIARQAGVIAFLAEYYAERRDPHARAAVQAGLATLNRLSLPVSNGWPQSFVEYSGILSAPIGRGTIQRVLARFGLLYRSYGDGRLVTMNADYGSAVTGATALALIAELQYFEATGDDRFRNARSTWVNGLLALHVPGRGFRSAPATVEESPFFNGEAWLALANYDRIHPHTEAVVRVLRSLDTYLMTRYADDVATGFYQWGSMAAAVRFEITSDRRFLEFMAGQALRLVDALSSEARSPGNSCFLVEGLATAGRLLSRHRQYDAIVRKIEHHVSDEMEKNRRLQIPPHARRIKLADGAYLASPHLARFAGAFLEGETRPYTRIDFTGHCLAAMLKVQQHVDALAGTR
jgi:hypothetical protein